MMSPAPTYTSHPTSLYFTLLTTLHLLLFFFFNDTATTEIYTLSLHDALPISAQARPLLAPPPRHGGRAHQPRGVDDGLAQDRKSTRLNSSHGYISYAVFCLKKKKKKNKKINKKNKKKINIR